MRKSKGMFRYVLRLYRKKRKHLSESACGEIREALGALQQAVQNKDKAEAKACAERVEHLRKIYLKKSLFEQLRHSVFVLAFALAVAVVIRSMWFELYKIPSGSMRPTLEEKDRLFVSKTEFGMNIPLSRGHFYFDPNLIKRGRIVIFTGAGMDIADLDTVYFYLFPGKKQYIKRLVGKPGDTLYFYGGKIYGINQAGEDISQELQLEKLSKIDHVPYIHLNGKTLFSKRSSGMISSVTLKQMNQAVAKLNVTSLNKVEGTLLPPYSDHIPDYYDLWGFKNYGMGRLLTAQEVSEFTNTPLAELGEAPLYLEIIHHPSVKHPTIARGYQGELHPSCGTNSAVLPLKENHLRALFNQIYTARFTIENGTVYRFGSPIQVGKPCPYCPKLSNVPDGTYEMYYGKGYKVLWGGITKELPVNHPLLQYSHKNLQLLYNLGIECNTLFAPHAKNQYLFPSRYVYFNEGSLYTMGAPFVTKGDATLEQFLQKEQLKQENAPTYRPYIPFEDAGPPDATSIKQYGITVPKGHYLVLGDNYAMSADSRDFGFVPATNIRGAPTFIFWSPSNFGPPLQVSYPFFNAPRITVWCLAFVAITLWRIYDRKRYHIPQEIP